MWWLQAARTGGPPQLPLVNIDPIMLQDENDENQPEDLDATETAMAQQLFSTLDVDNVGYLRVDQLITVHELTPAALMELLDTNRDQVVDLTEWMIFLRETKAAKGQKFARFLQYLNGQVEKVSTLELSNCEGSTLELQSSSP